MEDAKSFDVSYNLLVHEGECESVLGLRLCLMVSGMYQVVYREVYMSGNEIMLRLDSKG